MRTVSVALVLCLNVGVDPPDVVKISPCAKLQCWIGKLETNEIFSSTFSSILLLNFITAENFHTVAK